MRPVCLGGVRSVAGALMVSDSEYTPAQIMT